MFFTVLFFKCIVSILGEPEFQGVSFERKDDSFLLRFLRARKFDQERSLSLYTNYYKNRRDFPKIFSDFTPQSVADLLCSGAINVLDGRMNDGSKVIKLIKTHFRFFIR